MNMTYKMRFFESDAGDGSGGGEPDGVSHPAGIEAFTPTKTQVAEIPLPETKHKEPTPKEPAEKPEGGEPEGGEPKPGFDTSFAKELGATIGDSLRPVLEKKVAEKELSPEEARRILNVWEPDDSWYATYDNLETRKDAVIAMRDGLLKQFDTLTQLRLQEAIDAFKGEISPQLKEVQTLAELQREERFNKGYPQLAKPELRPLITAVAQDLVNQNKRFTTEGEMFKALAGGVEALLKNTNPDFKLETGDVKASSGRSNNAIPTTTPGSGGSVGRSGVETPQQLKRGLSIFSK
jgi:hypothetical protein